MTMTDRMMTPVMRSIANSSVFVILVKKLRIKSFLENISNLENRYKCIKSSSLLFTFQMIETKTDIKSSLYFRIMLIKTFKWRLHTRDSRLRDVFKILLFSSNYVNTIFIYKGWVKKNLTKWNFVFAISQLKNHRNSTILVPTPHNY